MPLVRNLSEQYILEPDTITHRALARLAQLGIFAQIARIKEATDTNCNGIANDTPLNADTLKLLRSAAIGNPA
jgi:hypothetical protein